MAFLLEFSNLNVVRVDDADAVLPQGVCVGADPQQSGHGGEG